MNQLKELDAKIVKGIFSQELSDDAEFVGCEINDNFIKVHIETKNKWSNSNGGCGSDNIGKYFPIGDDDNLALFIPEKQIKDWRLDSFAYSRVDKYDMWFLFERLEE